MQPKTPCIEANGDVNWAGYVRVRHAGKRIAAHRLAWQNVYGDIPEGIFVCHHCDNRKCINVDHLFLGTHAQNMADRNAKNRQHRPKGERHPRAKLSAESVIEAFKLYGSGMPCAQIAEKFGVKAGTIRRALSGRGWEEIGEKVNLKDKTHCPYGHPYSGANLHLTKEGTRVCVECRRAAKRRYLTRSRASQISA